ncbi:hypothetical protein FACS189432_02780 [Bacteroidia bacterium]|nr:hypothetical protein FACS189432_02780 [Bacteroidia bacterium]
MKTKLYSLFLLSFVFFEISAQQVSIRGRIIDEKEGSSLSYATVTLHKDSLFVDGTASDSEGKFTLKNIEHGSYLLTVSFLGYKTERIRIDELGQSIDIGNIAMNEDTNVLNEVVVQADPIINKIDRQILLPNQSQIKVSNNAFDLLSNLMISRLHVNSVFKTISISGGGNVQTRINGIKASKEEVAALRAKDVLRVEYIDSPGAQYKSENVEAVVNIIVKRREAGGIIAVDGLNAPFIRFGENNISAKYNHKQSEWGVIYDLSYRSAKERWRDLNESFYYPDNQELTRKQEGIIAPLQNNTQIVNLSYNLLKSGKYTFNVVLKNYYYQSPKDDWNSVMHGINSGIDTYTKTKQSEKQQKPSLDLYFQYKLPNNQSIYINAVGTYNNSQYKRHYEEIAELNTLTSIFTEVDGKKYSLISEGIYERLLGKEKLNAGIKYNQIKSENRYSGNKSVSTNMNQSEYYVFADLTGKLSGQWSYLLGAGLSRSWFSESGQDQLFYTFCPTVQLSYNVKKNATVRYRFSIKPTLPTLSLLSDVEQAIDSLQLTKGNPDLKPYRTYRNSISYSFFKDKFNSEIFTSYLFYDKPIMEDVFVKNNQFVITENNQVNWQKINIEANVGFAPLDIGNLKNFVSFNLSGGFSRFISNGNLYAHRYNNFYYNAMATLMYQKWILLGEFRTFQSSLYGERIKYGENQQTFMLLFRPSRFTVGLGVLFPFSSTFKEGYERLNKVVPIQSWTYVNESSRMIIAKLSYDFSIGRKYNAGRRRLNNEDDTNSGILKSDR